MTARSVFRLSWIAALALASAACEAEKSRNPLSPSVAGPIPGVTITAPRPLEPIGHHEILVSEQPVRLLFENASSTGERPFWFVVEVAGDNSFGQTLYTGDKVAPDENGRTSHTLPALTAGRTYYWRVKAEDGANSGPYSEPAAFQIVLPVVIEPPVPVSPVGGQTTASAAPNFVLTNGAVSGPAGTVEYRVEVARDQGFVQMAGAGAAVRSAGGTTTVNVGGLPAAATLYWRARGSDGKVTSAWSATQSFRTPSAPTPGPGPAPGPPSQQCGPQSLGADRSACVQAVAATSAEWPQCVQGNGVACHRFTREVARALAAGDPRWGLLGKGSGQWQCTAAVCGGLGGEGFGEDVVAYCLNPATCQNRNGNDGRTDWQGFDIVVGAGLPGASVSWQVLPQVWNRGNNFWSPVP
jgi:hypothetical protein